MARRALPKIDPRIDLSRHLSELSALGERFDPAAWFGRSAPLEVEVGSGKGLFLVRAASERPDHDFVGVELAKQYARTCGAKLAKAGLTNALMISGDGVRFSDEFLADDSVAAFHVYFPDPWWKARHRKRRVLNRRLLQAIESKLVVGGRLHFWTDVQEYFESTLELIPRVTTLLDGPHPVAEPQSTHDLDYRTHFERRTRLAELPVYRAEFVRLPGQVVRPLPADGHDDEADDSDARDSGDEPTGVDASEA
ncbi:MAG TPA: tRNA (guanosine(46)-N7)-methyltransferase TrmB [Planctomycetaceae bacterium]|nr:tRNA (guanosine(46)-N7)-methyltransferase TrmB [Planctomycetaceae bacterium]HRE99858.1 tRNA (guanosine(46)-N7)-methyltransferase TrmB [Pirellulaceae bacterium]